MSTTSISEYFGSAAVAGTYAGTTTPQQFGSPATELAALRQGCAIFDLTWRGKLIVGGADRVRWLNGVVSNNTRELATNRGNYSFVLDPQGHIQADVLTFQRGDYYLLETERAQLPALREFFEHYIVMDDVELEDLGFKLASLGLGGPQASEVLRRAGLLDRDLSTGELVDLSRDGLGYSLLRDPIARRDWYELWCAPSAVAVFWTQLVSAGATPTGSTALEQQRILLGLPRLGHELNGRALAQETGQDYALSASKGCYIGQEIVERVRAHGKLHRRLTGFVVDGAPPECGRPIGTDENQEAGEITSAVCVEIAGQTHTVALGYLRSSMAEAPLRVDGQRLAVRPLPFEF